jgi:hypothetical protein
MPIRALEICAATFLLRADVPATASLVCDQWSAVGFCDTLGEFGVFEDGTEAVVDGKGGALDGAKGFGEIVVGLL